MNIEELKDWQDGARRVLGRKADGMRENLELVTYIIRSFDANGMGMPNGEGFNESTFRKYYRST